MQKIILEIEKKIWDSILIDERVGVLNGLSGIALFYKYLIDTYDVEEYHQKLITIVDKINYLISENDCLPSFCSGIAGYGWVLLQIQNKNIEIDDEYFQSIDLILSEALIQNCDNNDYDFLHGALGIAMYFIKRYELNKNDFAKNLLIEFTSNLSQKIELDIESVIVNKTDKTSEKSISFGLAHGVSGLLNFLIHLEKKLDGVDLNVELSIKKCLGFLSRFKKYDKQFKQYYPGYFMIEDNIIKNPRLGWCQGDLGIGNAMYNAGIFLNDKKIQDDSIKLIDETRKISFEESLVNDFAMCHGSTGILLQYHLASSKFDKDYSEIIQIWFDNLIVQTNEFNEFNAYLTDKYISETNILYGSAGLGLTLLTLDNKINLGWLECLNLY